MITIDDFGKVELRVGKVVNCEPVEGSEKLLKLTVDLGEGQPRQILSGIAKWYTPEDLINNSYIFIANLEPRMMLGLESAGMILATEDADGTAIPLAPLREVAAGSKVR